jgi:hypothetical protein
MKKCSKCKEEKELSEFPKTKTNKDGYSYLCFPCNRETSRRYRQENSETYYRNQKQKRQEEPTFVAQLLYATKTRAQKKKLDHTLTFDFLLKLLKESEYKCAVTGLEMNLKTDSRKKANLFKCSLDRIDSTKGYTEDNVQFVCWAVNQMKADKTEDELKFWTETLYKAISSQA